MAGRTRTRHGKTCGAKTRKGTPCQRKLLFRGGKCPNHGGLSTGAKTLKPGPKTESGKARSYAARDAGRARRWQKHRLAALAGLADPRPRLGRAGEQEE